MEISTARVNPRIVEQTDDDRTTGWRTLDSNLARLWFCRNAALKNKEINGSSKLETKVDRR